MIGIYLNASAYCNRRSRVVSITSCTKCAAMISETTKRVSVDSEKYIHPRDPMNPCSKLKDRIKAFGSAIGWRIEPSIAFSLIWRSTRARVLKSQPAALMQARDVSCLAGYVRCVRYLSLEEVSYHTRVLIFILLDAFCFSKLIWNAIWWRKFDIIVRDNRSTRKHGRNFKLLFLDL